MKHIRCCLSRARGLAGCRGLLVTDCGAARRNAVMRCKGSDCLTRLTRDVRLCVLLLTELHCLVQVFDVLRSRWFTLLRMLWTEGLSGDFFLS
jgi:hypothetical protein